MRNEKKAGNVTTVLPSGNAPAAGGHPGTPDKIKNQRRRYQGTGSIQKAELMRQSGEQQKEHEELLLRSE